MFSSLHEDDDVQEAQRRVGSRPERERSIHHLRTDHVGVSTSTDRPKKRVRISESSEKERRVLSFLDVEAGEAVEGNGEEDEDQDDLDALDDEIDVEEWHETTRTVSLAIESQTSDNSEDWGSFLSRAHKRAQESASSRVNEDATSPSLLIQTAHDVLASASWIPKKTDLSGFLWRVPVR
ncbi:hypothetical protein H0H93_012704, partial [Arthromyces matolae]